MTRTNVYVSLLTVNERRVLHVIKILKSKLKSFEISMYKTGVEREEEI